MQLHVRPLSRAAAAGAPVVAAGSGRGVHVRLSRSRCELAPVVPLAAPIPRAPWAGGARRLSHRSDRARGLRPTGRSSDTFGGRAGWTVAHSQSGFNAFRHHLLGYRTPSGPHSIGEMLGNLVTARNVLDSVREGRIDVGPLDAYWHLLIARHAPRAHRAACACWQSTPVRRCRPSWPPPARRRSWWSACALRSRRRHDGPGLPHWPRHCCWRDLRR